MKNLSVIAPIKKPEDIDFFAKNTKCREFYVYHHRFMHNNFEYIQEFIDAAKKNNSKIYVNFKHNITEEELGLIKKFIKYLCETKINGLFVNSYAILEAIKSSDLPFEVIIDSYFDIHNLSGIDFVNTFHKVHRIIITEDIYLKNISKLKKCTKMKLSIDSDNLPWNVEDIKKIDAIDSVMIKGKFSNSEEIFQAINLVENIIKDSSSYKNRSLPFKHVRKSIYQTNHFSGEMLSAKGANFEFSKNIKKFDYEYKSADLKKNFYKTKREIPPLNLRLSSLAQVKEVGKYIKKIGFNPIKSIEYGEIVSTKDLAKSSFSEVITKVKKFCDKNQINLQISTPKILIERDFDRVYEYVKMLCLEEPTPSSIIINNIGYFWAIINDNELNHIPIEIGEGINLLNSMSIKCLSNMKNIETIDFSSFSSIENIEKCIKKIKNIIPVRKITIAGNVRVPTLGLCPLNNDSAIVSRLSCKAPCRKGHFALHDPSLNKIYPFVVDGFCKMHMYKNEILNLFDYIFYLQDIGINNFVIDANNLNEKFIPTLINEFLNANVKIKTDIDKKNLEEDFTKLF